MTLLISFSSENIVGNRTIQNFFFIRRKKCSVQKRLNGYQPFLLFLRFFLGFGRHIGFFGVGGKLAAAILSLRACLQGQNQ